MHFDRDLGWIISEVVLAVILAGMCGLAVWAGVTS
jgi:hypothetical protein